MSEKRVGAIVLAAGSSRRFGKENKLLADVGGEVMIKKVVGCLVEAEVSPIIVVVGHERERIIESLKEMDTCFVVNRKYEQGMGTSIVCGVGEAMRRDLNGVLVCLGDLPYLTSHDVKAIRSRFLEQGCSKVVVPEFEGRRGHPVCFPERCFGSLLALEGDQGAKAVVPMLGEPKSVTTVGPGCIKDLDTNCGRMREA